MRCWIGVASADHVARGRDGGFMQLGHGKAAPLRRVSPGDVIVYYSPKASFVGRDRLQAFTAIGVVAPGEPYPASRADGASCTRRDVLWRDARIAPIGPLLDELDLTRGRAQWGALLRFGLVEITAADAERIAAAMVRLPAG